jgi:hypothetical protein
MDLSFAKEVRVDIASKTIVDFNDGQGVITVLNDTRHLSDM